MSTLYSNATPNVCYQLWYMCMFLSIFFSLSSSEQATHFLESAKASEPARSKLPLANGMGLSSTKTLPINILVPMMPTRQRVSNVKPQDKDTSLRNLTPHCTCTDCSSENDHSNLKNCLVASKHHDCFAKSQSSSDNTSVLMESKSSESSSKTKPRLPDEAVSRTLSRSGFSFIVNEKPAVRREAEAANLAKKTSQTMKNPEVSYI